MVWFYLMNESRGIHRASTFSGITLATGAAERPAFHDTACTEKTKSTPPDVSARRGRARSVTPPGVFSALRKGGAPKTEQDKTKNYRVTLCN